MSLLWRPKRIGQKRPVEVADFLEALPWRDEHQERAARGPTPAELRMKINAVMRTLGGKPKRKGPWEAPEGGKRGR